MANGSPIPVETNSRYRDEPSGQAHRRGAFLHHACIRHRFASGVAAAWEFGRDGEIIKISPSGPLIASTKDLAACLRDRRAHARADRLAAEFFRPLPQLSEPHIYACSAAGLRRFHQKQRRCLKATERQQRALGNRYALATVLFKASFNAAASVTGNEQVCPMQI